MGSFRSSIGLLAIGSFLLGSSVVLLLWAVTELGGGISEVGSHWWSALPLAGCAVGLATMVAAVAGVRASIGTHASTG